MANIRTVKEINEKIKKGDAIVLTAAEMINLVEEKGEKIAAYVVSNRVLAIKIVINLFIISLLLFIIGYITILNTFRKL